jgi:hypothetical protein
LSGRCANGYERGAGRVVHAVQASPDEKIFGIDSYAKSLCGKTHGARSAGWSHDSSLAITCPKCAKAQAACQIHPGKRALWASKNRNTGENMQQALTENQDTPTTWDSLLEAREMLADKDAEIAALRLDAERYRWLSLQDLTYLALGYVVDTAHDGEYFADAGEGKFYGETLGAAIDKAIAQAVQPKTGTV